MHRTPYFTHNQTLRTVDGEMTEAEDIKIGLAATRLALFVRQFHP
jgi:hypothetical protein